MPEVAQPLGFKRVMACLQRDSSSLASIEAPPGRRQPEMVMEPTVAMMYATCIVQDEAAGVTHMDVVTASVGRVALRTPTWWPPSWDPLWKISQTSLKEPVGWLP